MQLGSLRTELIYDTIKSELASFGNGEITSACFPQSVKALKEEYPQLDDQQVISLLEIVIQAISESRKEKINLVATVPPSFSLKTRRIQNVTIDLIKNAQKSILLTGYSVSGFIAELIDLLIEKSQKGVFIKVFLNDVKNQLSIDKLLRYKSKFLQIYDYNNHNDKMSALHAKMLVIDNNQTIISSANLSYHGMAGNIELGTYINSERIAKQIEELFRDLLFNNVFVAIPD